MANSGRALQMSTPHKSERDDRGAKKACKNRFPIARKDGQVEPAQSDCWS
jgi:hypothetical protein